MSVDFKIYTDGSCINNKRDEGIGGYSAIIYDAVNNFPKFIVGYEENTTNQRMELIGVISGLESIHATRSKVVVCTDSAYVFNCMLQGWYKNWEQNGWVNANKDPVANKDLWIRLLALIDRHKVDFIKVKAHQDNMFNNECDRLAKSIVEFQTAVKANIDKRIRFN